MYEYDIKPVKVDYDLVNELLERASYQPLDFSDIIDNFEDEAIEIIEFGVINEVGEDLSEKELSELVDEAIEKDLSDVVADIAADFVEELEREIENFIENLQDSISNIK